MIILNVTINIDEAIHQQGYRWLQTGFIPAMMDTQKFSEVLMTQVLVTEETGGKTYSLQFKCSGKRELNVYYERHDTAIFKEFKQFEGRIVFFKTELEIISLQEK